MSIDKGERVGIPFIKECMFMFSLPGIKCVPTDFFIESLYRHELGSACNSSCSIILYFFFFLFFFFIMRAIIPDHINIFQNRSNELLINCSRGFRSSSNLSLHQVNMPI